MIRKSVPPVPELTLNRNPYGQIPLLNRGRERFLVLSEPERSERLIAARRTLQAFHKAYTRDLPELEFSRGQEQIDLVASYLCDHCPERLEDSITTELARYSDESLSIASINRDPDEHPHASHSTPSQRWNVLEARRRVRKKNTVVQDFNKAWDEWVAEQTPQIQEAARRGPDGEVSDEATTQSPFGDFYFYCLVAADGEIRQQKDIAEALVLQYPGAFPGFMLD